VVLRIQGLPLVVDWERVSARDPSGTAGTADAAQQADPDHALGALVDELHDQVALVQVRAIEMGGPVDPVDLPKFLDLDVDTVDEDDTIPNQPPGNRLRKSRPRTRDSVGARAPLPFLVQPVSIWVVSEELARSRPRIRLQMRGLIREIEQLKDADEIRCGGGS
jgi:hypothetical protein